MRSAATLTFLFTDIEGSTRRWEVSAGMHDRVEEHFRMLQDAITDAGGEVFATMGDGVAAAFGSAEEAAAAAAAAQRALPGTGLPVRMGMHTGPALRSGSDYRGRSLNRAARIAACAHGGQVLVSETTATLLKAASRRFVLADLGVHHLRDLSEPERLWQLVVPGLQRDFPPIRVGTDADTSLPVRRSTLVGRDTDIRAVADLITTHPLVTLVGMGGVGKTRLAIATAGTLREVFDVVRFVDLSPIESSAGAVEVVAATIGPIEPGRSTLIVLDNCEQVVGAAAAVLDDLLSSSEVHVLATSRERLQIEGELTVPVRPLRHGTAAVELFRTRAAEAGVQLDGRDAQLVAEICRRVDGMPLAIELAAARVPTLGLRALLGALDECLDVLRTSRRGPERHSTMTRTIDWSTRLLADDERRLLEWLSAFGGGFELDAAAHVAAALGIAPDRVMDLVGALVTQSLLEVEHTREGARYRMLWLVRSHALEALDRNGERRDAMARQADWVAGICDLPADEPCSAAVECHTLRLEREVDNWRQAIQWASSGGADGPDPEQRSKLIGRLCGTPTAHFLLGRHDLAEMVRRLPALCDDPQDLRAVLCAVTTCTAGALDASALRQMSDEIRRLEPDRPTGLATLIDWIACTWNNEIERGVDVVLAAADDPRLAPDTRDLFLGIATTDRFSLTDCQDRRQELGERCLAVATTTTVRTQRAACLLGAAWALLPGDPTHALELVELALDEIPFLPSYLRQTLPGNASRLLLMVDPERAASDLASRIEQIDFERASFTELIPVVYATALLDSVGHPSAAPALLALRSSPVASYVEIVGLAGVGGLGASTGDPIEFAALLDELRSALTDSVHR